MSLGHGSGATWNPVLLESISTTELERLRWAVSEVRTNAGQGGDNVAFEENLDPSLETGLPLS